MIINFTTVYNLNFMLDLEKEYDKTLKNIPTGSEDCLRIEWKCMKFALIV